MARFQVVLAQFRLFHYRVALFERMRTLLAERDIDLHLVHGQASATERQKKDEGNIAWADKVTNAFWRVGNVDLVWTPTPPALRHPDLYIAMQENRILSNYPWQLRRKFGGPMFAYWGHGANFQSRNSKNLRERWKRLMTNQVDHWFAYTQLTIDLITAQGFPRERITNLNNSIDTDGFRAQCDAVTQEQMAALRQELGIPAEAPIGLFCGSLYAEKKLDLLVAAGDIVKQRLPGFHMVIIGAGPALPVMQDAARTRPWIHLAGVRTGQIKAVYFRASQVQLNPGLVGLHILDSFVAGLPMISTRNALHSPEIAYLEDGVTGVLTGDGADSYAEGVLRLLTDEAARKRTSEAAMAASKRYSIGAMAEAFVDGIVVCRDRGPRKS